VDATAAERRERDCYRDEVAASVSAGVILAMALTMVWCFWGLL
jgi:hypothetical protein